MGREDLVRLLAQPQEGNLNNTPLSLFLCVYTLWISIEIYRILICSCVAVHSWNEDGLPWAQEASRPCWSHRLLEGIYCLVNQSMVWVTIMTFESLRSDILLTNKTSKHLFFVFYNALIFKYVLGEILSFEFQMYSWVLLWGSLI